MKTNLLSGLFIIISAINICFCSSEKESKDQKDLHIVPDGKADNYYSSQAYEFEISAAIPVEMTEEEFADETERQELANCRITAVGLYLTAYITDKFRGIDKNGDGVISEDEIFFHNEGYGGFHAMVRNSSIDDIDIIKDEQNNYQVNFTIDMAGPKNLLSIIPAAENSDENRDFEFEFKMPKGATIDPDEVPRLEIRNFDPETYIGELETVRCSVRQLPDISNAYPYYNAFIEDGVYDITLFYGHDYNKSRSDLSEAREAFNTLKDLDFTLPVEKFEDLKYDSGAFIRQAKANGQDFIIEVRIFHSDMFINSREYQHDLALSEITSRDVFFYNGHAGPYYAFYLDENKEAIVYYYEFATAPFTEKQQFIMAQGCQTYSQYADMLYANPLKNEDNLDVITTVNYSYGEGTMEVLKNLIKLDQKGSHEPVDYYRIIDDVNTYWINEWRDVFYGVMGIERNPQLHPYANIESIGRECNSVDVCGDAHGNICVAGLDNVKRCGALTLSKNACPQGTKYYNLAHDDTIESGACF